MIIIIRRNDTNVIGLVSVATAVITLSTVSMGADTPLVMKIDKSYFVCIIILCKCLNA